MENEISNQMERIVGFKVQGLGLDTRIAQAVQGLGLRFLGLQQWKNEPSWKVK